MTSVPLDKGFGEANVSGGIWNEAAKEGGQGPEEGKRNLSPTKILFLNGQADNHDLHWKVATHRFQSSMTILNQIWLRKYRGITVHSSVHVIHSRLEMRIWNEQICSSFWSKVIWGSVCQHTCQVAGAADGRSLRADSCRPGVLMGC